MNYFAFFLLIGLLPGNGPKREKKLVPYNGWQGTGGYAMTRLARFSDASVRLREFELKNLFNLRAFGFAFNRAWVYLMFLGTGASVVTWNGAPVRPEVFTISTISLCITLFGAALLKQRIEALLAKSTTNLAALSLVVIGTFCVSLSTLPNMPISLLIGAGGILTGVGSGTIDLAYGEQYRNVDQKSTLAEIPFAFFLAGIIFFLVLQLSSQAACLVTAALPAASGVILIALGKKSPHTGDVIPAAKINELPFAIKMGCCACLVGIADGVVRATFMGVNAVQAPDFYHVALPLSGVLSMGIIYVCALFSRNQNVRNVYKLAMFAMAFFFMLLPVFSGTAVIEGTIALTGYGTFNALIWMLIAGISQRYRISGLTAFGIGWGMVTLGVFAGSMAGNFICSRLTLTHQMLSLIALGATMAVLFSYMFVLREEDLALMIEEPESEAAGEGNIESTQDRFDSRCNAIAEEYGLTERELEVMQLMAKGRSNKRIQEELFISRGTCSTHIRHIYQKLDIHNRQDLIDLIEGRLQD